MTKQKANLVSYVANDTIWSLQHEKYFTKGEVIAWDLDGGNVPDFALLLNAGIISPVGQPKEIFIQEVGNGEDYFTRPADNN